MSQNPIDPPPPDPADAGATQPGPARQDQLSWRPQRMVDWFDPLQLLATGIQSLLSGIFGAYADKREVQAALSQGTDQPQIHQYDADEELWIDYTADLGDGFDPTYTVAWLLAQPQLTLANPAAPGVEQTRRGRILLLGGDQVYPTASRREYEQRFSGPYAAALPWCAPEARPRMFAIPGNHDWYDGLTAFLRQFCQQRWIGGWQTRQTRSYFALKLPHRWWLLGTDIQLESDIDKPQLEYFRRVAEQMQPGDQVILCTARPAWVEEAQHPGAFDNLAFFERTVLCPRGARLVLTLTGDLHHYSRYSDASGELHKITAGGGGAYLYGTHLLPERVELQRPDAPPPAPGARRETVPFTRQRIYPSAAVSRLLRWGALRLPLHNWRFSLLMGVVYALYAWFLQGASRQSPRVGEPGFTGWVKDRPLADAGLVLNEYLLGLFRSPLLLFLSVLIVYGMWRFCTPDRRESGWLRGVGLLHGVAHLMVAVGLTWLISWTHLSRLGWSVDTLGQTLLFGLVFTLEMVVLGGLVGGFLMGLALLPGVNFNEAFSCQHIRNYKNFLRMRLAPDGSLTVYPVGVDRVKRWKFVARARPGQPLFEPADGRPPSVRLIEGPIHIPAPAPARVRVQAVHAEG